MNFSTILADAIQSDFWTTFLPILRYILFGVVVVCAIGVVVTVLWQTNSSSESGDILSGSVQESYYAKNKGSTREGKLKIITIVLSSIIALSALIFFITEIFNKTV